MPRPLRINYPGAWYHVMNRGLGYKIIYDNNKHREIFLNLLSEAFEKFGLVIHGYCLMDNHYHLLVQTPYGNLSRAMRHINGVYTQRYNQNKKTDGPLFRGRYKAILIEGDSYLLQVSRYIHLNPLEARIAKKIESYRWSSYKNYIALEACPIWLQTNKILSIMSHQKSTETYWQFVMDGIDEETRIFYSKKNLPIYFGTKEKKQELLKNLKPKQIQAAITDYRLLEALPSLTEVLVYCSKYFNRSVDELTLVQRGKNNMVRHLAIYACRKWTQATLAEIGQMFGGISINGVSNAIARTNDKIARDATMLNLFKGLSDQFD